MKPPLLLFLLLALFTSAALRAEENKPAPRAQFIYLLRLVERLHDDQAWTQADKDTVGRHFLHLKAATESRQAIAVGRTKEPGDKTFGLVIFEADNAEAARAFAESDPAVVGGVMTVEVHPFALVLLRKQ